MDISALHSTSCIEEILDPCHCGKDVEINRLQEEVKCLQAEIFQLRTYFKYRDRPTERRSEVTASKDFAIAYSEN